MAKPAFSQQIRNQPFLIRLGSWEYWPMHLVYTPVYLYWVYLSVKARAFVFFSAANPGIEFGGFFEDSKQAIYEKIPACWLPKTLFFAAGTETDQILSAIEQQSIGYPLIAKPNYGERGFLVEKIQTETELRAYLSAHQIDLIIQAYVAEPEEIGVLYYRYPGQERGVITSLTLKKYLSVQGDGTSSLRELILASPRARLQLNTLEGLLGDQMEDILPAGLSRELISIGNHCRGTTFLNGNHLIDDALVQRFDELSHQLDGIYFGRFDVKCRSLDDLKAGKHAYILEINGVKSEPTHIYQPGFSLWKAYGVLFRQWKTIYEISMANHARGVAFPALPETLRRFRAYLRYKKTWEKGGLSGL